MNTADITGFLAAWFQDLAAGTTIADFDYSGTVRAGDFSAFLSAWFQAVSGGCP